MKTKNPQTSSKRKSVSRGVNLRPQETKGADELQHPEALDPLDQAGMELDQLKQLETLDQLDHLGLIGELTDTEPEDWEKTTGPISGVGEDFYYVHQNDGREIWLNLDIDYLTIVCDEITLYEGNIEC